MGEEEGEREGGREGEREGERGGRERERERGRERGREREGERERGREREGEGERVRGYYVSYRVHLCDTLDLTFCTYICMYILTLTLQHQSRVPQRPRERCVYKRALYIIIICTIIIHN